MCLYFILNQPYAAAKRDLIKFRHWQLSIIILKFLSKNFNNWVRDCKELRFACFCYSSHIKII
jgi:hypothetical protein